MIDRTRTTELIESAFGYTHAAAAAIATAINDDEAGAINRASTNLRLVESITQRAVDRLINTVDPSLRDGNTPPIESTSAPAEDGPQSSSENDGEEDPVTTAGATGEASDLPTASTTSPESDPPGKGKKGKKRTRPQAGGTPVDPSAKT